MKNKYQKGRFDFHFLRIVAIIIAVILIMAFVGALGLYDLLGRMI